MDKIERVIRKREREFRKRKRKFFGDNKTRPFTQNDEFLTKIWVTFDANQPTMLFSPQTRSFLLVKSVFNLD